MGYERKGEWLLLQVNGSVRVETLLNDLSLKCEYRVSRKNKFIEEPTLQSGDVVWMKVFEDHEVDFIAESDELDVVYEDDLLLVVNKPAGIMVHPDNKDGTGTLANRVAYYYQSNGIMTTVRPLHRLDRDTCGMVIFSKCPKLQPYLDALLKDKKIGRKYYAVVDGYYRNGQKVVIDAPIGRDRHVSNKYRVSETGKNALTYVTCLQSSRKENRSLVECTLDTGRTHQIRVHLSHHKHPLVGDKIYNPTSKYPHLALQAYMLYVNSILYDDGLEISLQMDSKIRKLVNKWK